MEKYEGEMDTSHARRSARPPQRQELSKDTAFELMSDQRRRYVLHALLREGGVATLGELTTRFQTWETDTDADDIAEDLRTVHLPQFEAVGVLAYYTASDVVELLDPADTLLPYLELATSDEFDADS